MTQEERFPELDALRGIAVLMMIGYHLAFDLEYFYGYDVAIWEGEWKLLRLLTASLFLLLVGVCFTISWSRRSGKGTAHNAPTGRGTLRALYPTYLKRGLIILSGGIVISLVTYAVAPDAFVKFGILHLIGVSAFLQPFFARLKTWNALIGLACIALPALPAFPEITRLPFLFPLGVPYEGFASLDYYPLLPWFGIILIGMSLGSRFYTPTRHPTLKFLFPSSPRAAPAKWDPLSLLLRTGKHAFLIYFLHQPLLLLILRTLSSVP